MTSPVSPRKVLSCALPPSLAWQRLVSRSIEAWGTLTQENGLGPPAIRESLELCGCVDDFLTTSSRIFTFWFFQRRDAFLSQERFSKWSPESLDDYVVLPAASGYVSRQDFFFVSHFWQTQDHPDPDGEYLRLMQAELRIQHWSYIWTCMPQDPRSPVEEAYFFGGLATISGIIRNCGFMYYYPPFQARIWILYEVAEYTLTCESHDAPTPDIEKYRAHVHEMLETSVQSVFEKYGYRCSQDRDKAFLTSWLELLILLKGLRIDLGELRRILDHLTYQPTVKEFAHHLANGLLRLRRYEGILTLNEECYTFTPFPRWGTGKFAATHEYI